MTRSISAASLEFVPVWVRAASGGALYNPTADVVEFAFTGPGAALVGAHWYPGTWEGLTAVGGWYTALCLVGPGGVAQLAPGQYQVSVRVTDNPEIPAIPAYPLTVTG
jgi:hypothetical protein